MSMSEARVQQDDPFRGEVIPPHLAIKAMRDSGYKNTAYALAELIDNSIQANAGLVEVFCIEKRVLISQRERTRITAIAVCDNGDGMNPETLRSALQFGNGTRLNDRSGIGRFGMGSPNASISQCRRVEVWTWQAGPDNAVYSYLDLDEIERGGVRAVPEPIALGVPSAWRSLSRGIGTTGTLVVWSNFKDNRLTWRGARATLANTEALSGRMYRKFIHDATVEIRLVAALENEEPTSDENAKVNDPLYLMTPSSTPQPFDKTPMFKRWGEADTTFDIEINGSEPHSVFVRMSWARPETIPKSGTNRGATTYGKHAARNIGLSIVRAGRELELEDAWALGYDPTERWWGAEVEFPPALDEVFGVTNNKQTATVFSQMAKFDWEKEAEPNETFPEFKDRLQEEGDTRYLLIGIVEHIKLQLSKIRDALKDQTKGRRPGNKRHDDSVIDTASTKWKERAERSRIDSDNETFTEVEERHFADDLHNNKGYDEEVAAEIAQAVRLRDRKVIFVEAKLPTFAFFDVDPQPGGVTEVVFNSSHPAYDKLLKMLDLDVSEMSDSDMLSRMQNASDTLRLLFAAWARYEEEDVFSRDKITEMRYEWGKMAKNFLTDGR